MNLLNFKSVNRFIKLCLFFLAFSVQVKVKAWDIDLSRRQKDLIKSRVPASIVDQPEAKKEDGILTHFFDSIEPTQEIVLLQTENGFVPETVRIKKGQSYRFHVVNVNQKEKNTSFILDAFSEHHATYFGQEKSFSITPKAEGIYSFVSPETAKQGRIIVISDSDRKPASN